MEHHQNLKFDSNIDLKKIIQLTGKNKSWKKYVIWREKLLFMLKKFDDIKILSI